MAATSKREKANVFGVAFWDASALVPLCCAQPQTAGARRARRLFPRLITWWATAVECSSAIRRLERSRLLTLQETDDAFHELTRLRHRWVEIEPTAELRETAEQLLAQHDLRAADACQLAAALIWCGFHSKGRRFVTGDGKLSAAAEREGFMLIKL